MSSLNAACADNFYYPPEWDPNKESLSVFTGHTKGRNQQFSRRPHTPACRTL